VKVVVNTRLLQKDKLEGIGWFSYQTLKRLTESNPQVHFIFLFDRGFDASFIFSDNITPLIVGPQARHPLLYYMWLQFSVRPLLRKLKPDVFLSPDGMLVLRATCRQVAVIHDINFLHFPEHNKWLTAKYYNYFFPRFAALATRIATVSEFSRREIVSYYGIPEEKIDVVGNGVNPFFRVLSQEEKTAVKVRYSSGKDYFIFVGSLHPRKNVTSLIKAFIKFRSTHAGRLKLVIAGPAFWGNSELSALIAASGLKEDIIITGRLDNESLALLLGAARALTFVPYYEGFGIPVIEAMAAGVPVITSSCSSLPEIAGDAALLVAPDDVAAISAAMTQILDPRTSERLIQAGFIQQRNYSWDKSALLLWQCILQAIKI
jgi:glycosyltransferase involved in cell wall biosynthesis